VLEVNAQLTRWFVSFAEFSCVSLARAKARLYTVFAVHVVITALRLSHCHVPVGYDPTRLSSIVVIIPLQGTPTDNGNTCSFCDVINISAGADEYDSWACCEVKQSF